MKTRLAPAAFALVLLPGLAAAQAADPVAAARTVTLRPGVSMGSVVSPGEPMSFEFHVSSDASVIVFDIDTRGQVHVLYPIGEPGVERARATYRLPEDGSDLFVEGERGVEFVFAVAVDDPSAIDRGALEAMSASDVEGREPYRVEGDPFLAANTIAGDLIRDVSRSGASFAYTYFYVSERVAYPCYLCGPCNDLETVEACSGYRIAQDFDRRSPLAYPLRRGYEMTDVASDPSTGSPLSPVVVPSDDGDVVVNFYPYGSQVRYVDPNLVGIYSDAWWYDPYYWYYPGWYPYYPGFSVSIGFGWGWGWGWGCWGGYYCSGWYDPWCYGGYYPGYPSYPSGYPGKFKSNYKSGADPSGTTLARNRTYAAQKDGRMRIASADVRPSIKQSPSMKSSRTRAGGRQSVATRSGYTRSFTKSRPSYTARDVTRAQMFRGQRGTDRSGAKAPSSGPRLRPNDRRSSSGAVRSRGSSPSSGRSHAVQPRSSSAPRSKSSAPASRGISRPASRGKGR
jgi:hypothetical protein